jgi:uncharacterized metal-binding protein
MQMSNKVKVIPCSGIGKVFGLVAREAALKTVLELCPEKAETVCLAYIVTGDEDVKEKMRGSDCITVDGCPKMCSSKNVTLAGGVVIEEVKVLDTVKDHKGKKFGSATELSDDGYTVADEIAGKIEKSINEIA